MAITESTLQGYVGKSIADICGNHFASPGQNHCAHFVSHALGIQLGMLCGDIAYKTRHTGASIRCDEIYNRLDTTGPWDLRPKDADALLVFVTSARNVANDIMANVPQKHVGVYLNGKVFNFSNSHHKVVMDVSAEKFLAKFQGAYSGDDISLFFGVVP